MTLLLGIDLGTSSIKAVLIDERASVRGVGFQEYPINTPRVGWAEQYPDDWWIATIRAVRQAVANANPPLPEPISAIGLSGQMHGVVLIDAAQQPLGSAIIWADQRSNAEVVAILARDDAGHLIDLAGTAPATGFMGPTLLWLLKHDPARLDRASACLLPKDYVRLRLTGEVATDWSDASATFVADVGKRGWSDFIIAQLGLPAHLFPTVLPSSSVAGTLTKASSEAFDLPAILPPGIPVVAGCADQVAQAVGNGMFDPGIGSVTIGTGGQVFAPLDRVTSDPRINCFCHAPADRWYMLGATLSAGLSLRWLRNLLGEASNPAAYDQLAALAADVPPGADGLVFLPYLIGERSPLMDSLARGSFIGLTLHHDRGHLVRAIMEGVAFAMRQIVDVIVSLDVPMDHVLASGNGLVSPLWRQIVTDVLNRPLYLAAGGERAGIGAALVAGIGAGVYHDYADLQKVIQQPTVPTNPDPQRVSIYAEQYERFVGLYPLLKDTLHDLGVLQS